VAVATAAVAADAIAGKHRAPHGATDKPLVFEQQERHSNVAFLFSPWQQFFCASILSRTIAALTDVARQLQ
jgi:hypothetical protein